MSKMKESGIEWIGEIPEHWNISKIKYEIKVIGSGTTPDSGNELYYDELNGKAWIQSGDLYGKKYIKNTEKKISELAIKENKSLWLYRNPFIVMAMYGASVGNVAISKIDAYTNQACCVIQLDVCNSLKYLYYYLSVAKEEMLQKAFGGTQPNINQIIIKNLNYLQVPIEEQKLIADFLDDRAEKIEAVLNDLNKQVEILEKYKKTLITESVTKGLNSNVNVRDTGIEWIEKVPEHWKIKRTLNLLKMPITDGPHTTPDLYDDGIPFVSAEAVSCGNGKINFDHIRGYVSEEFYKECCKKYIPEKNDIYMIKSGATTGRVAIVDTDDIFTIWSPLAVFRCNEQEMIHKFMFYSLQSTYFQIQVENNWSYGTQQNIGMRTLEHLKVCQPPIEEQEEIVKYLDKKCIQIDEIIKDKQKQIDKMEKYKKSLIYEYVTGKKRVKGAEELYV